MSSFSSDYDSSFATESEADNEYFWNEESSKNNVCLPNYATEVEDIIRENVDVTNANAIKLNHHYQVKLRLLRTQLETLLSQCQARLKDVDSMVDKLRLDGKEKIPYRIRAPGYICGQPFFKDHELYPGPHNADYLYRKNVKKEFFPLDMFEVAETNWTQKDKQNMKNGIWQQALEFLRRESALRVKVSSSTAKAECIRRDISSYKTLSLEEIWSKVQAYETEFGGQRFQVDWLVISNVNVMGRHTAAACEAMWTQYLKPGLKKGSWQPEEDSLLEAVRNHNYQDWSSIAQFVGNRSEYQCFVHFRSYFSQQAQIERKPWTPEEDACLLRMVQEHRIGSNIIWNKVVENMPYRNKIQVYHRYKYTLMRPIKGAKFTAEEDCIITAYVQQFGDDFKYFPEHLLPGRTVRQVWARYNNTLRYVDKRTGWSLEEDKRLMSYIAEHLTEEGPEKISWSDCSRHLFNHSRASCRSRYYTIEKFLEKHPNATLDDVPRRVKKKLSTDVTNENWIKTIINIKRMPNQDPDSLADDKLCHNFSTIGEWGLYEQMKFCFRYQFGHNLSLDCNQRQVQTGAKILMHLMEGFHESGSISNTYFAAEAHRSMMNAALQTSMDWASMMNAVYPQNTPEGDSLLFCRIPPNYNTVLGLRGVCLNAYYESANDSLPQPSKVTRKAKDTKRPHYDQALALFVDRFKKIFHWPMLLTMLNIDDVKFVTEAKLHEEPNKTLGNEIENPSSSGQPSSGTVSGAENSVVPENKKSIGHDQLIPIPINKLMQSSHNNTVSPQNSSIVAFSPTGVCENIAGVAECNMDMVKSITIIHPKDLPVSSNKCLGHWDDSVTGTMEMADLRGSPKPQVSRKRTRRHRQISQRQKMSSNEGSNESLPSFNGNVEKIESQHAQTADENQTVNSDPYNAYCMQSVDHSITHTVANTAGYGLFTYSKTELNKSPVQTCSSSDIVPQILSVHGALTTASCQEEHSKSFNLQEEMQSKDIRHATVWSNTITNYKCDMSELKYAFNQTENRTSISNVLNAHRNEGDFNCPTTSVVCLSQMGQTAMCSSSTINGIVSGSSDAKNATTSSGGNPNDCQISSAQETDHDNQSERPNLANHCKEVFIIREDGSEARKSPFQEFIVPIRAGNSHYNEYLIVEEHVAQINVQEDGSNDVRGTSIENPFEEILIASDPIETNECEPTKSKSSTLPAYWQQTVKAEFQAVQSNANMMSETALEQPTPIQVSTQECGSISVRHFGALLSTIDESYTAVDIIRILREGRNAEDIETTAESESEEES